jgi:hypothetical protein
MSFPYVRLEGSRGSCAEQFSTFAMQLGADRALQARMLPLGVEVAQRLDEVTQPNSELDGLLKNHVPDQCLESSILSANLNVSTSYLVCVSGLSDVVDWIGDSAPEECTCALRRCRDGVLHWQTWDFDAQMSQFACVVDRHVAGCHASVSLTTALGHAHFGVNAMGLAIGTQNMAFSNGRAGVPFSSIIARVLDECEDVEQAVELIARLPRMSGRRYTLSHKNGNACLVEVSPREIETEHVRSEAGVAVANHPRIPSIARLALDYSPTSRDRVGAMSAVLTKCAPDALYRPDVPILRSGDNDAFNTRTIALVSLDASKNTMYLARPDSDWIAYSPGDEGGRS